MFITYVFEPVKNSCIVFLFSPSSRPEVFCEKGVLKNFTKFTVKDLC